MTAPNLTSSQARALAALREYGPTQHHVLAVRLGYTSDQPLRPLMTRLLKLRLVSLTEIPASGSMPFTRIWAAR